MAGTLRHGLAPALGVESFGSQYTVRFQDSGNPGRACSGNRQVKDALDNRGGILVQNPVIFVLRVRLIAIGRLAQVLAAGATGFHHRTNLFAGIFGIKIVKKITKRREIVVSPFAVHAIVDGNEPHIVAWKNDFRIPAHLQVIPAKPAHVFNDPDADQALLYQRKPLLYAGAVEVRPSVPIVHQNACVCEATLSGVSGQDSPLIGNRI